MTLLYIYLTFSGLYVVVQLVISYLFIRSIDLVRGRNDLKLSVLVAARNEEENIAALLNSLANQTYPSERFQVIIADDQSTDRTGDIVKEFIKDRPNFHYLLVQEQAAGIKGKQNAIAQAAKLATGDYFIITDADIIHTREWATLMAQGFKGDNIGVVSAPTIVQPGDANRAMQALDWAMGVATIKAFDSAGLPITSVGNNMGVSREAYEAVGGYENIPFSITEDYKLFAEILKKGYKAKWLFNDRVAAYTQPIVGFGAILQQRKRWFMGGKEGPWYALLAFAFHGFSVPFTLAGLVLLPFWYGVGFWGLKWLSDGLLILLSTMTFRQTRSLIKYFPLYIVYHTLLMLILPFYIAFPTKIIWKGRTF